MGARNNRALLLSAVAGVLLVLVGCAGGPGAPNAMGGNAGQSTAAPQAAGGPVLPGATAGTGIAPAQRSSSTAPVLELLGDQFASMSSNATADNVAHTLQLAGGSQPVSWGLYGFDGVDQAELPRTLRVDLAGAAPHSLWLALADYTFERWEWHALLPAEGMAQLSFDNGGRYLNQGGTFYALLAVCGGDAAEIARLQLGLEQIETAGEAQWPMYGHDAQHTFRTAGVVPAPQQLQWSLDVGSAWHGLAIANSGLIYMINTGGTLTVIRSTGEVLWSLVIGPYSMSIPAVAPDGAAFFGTLDRHFYAVNPNGSVRWKFDTGGVVQTSAAIGPDGTVYFCGSQGLYACDQQTGLKWVCTAGGFCANNPAVAADGTVYYCAADQLWAVNPDGTVKWHSPDGVKADSSVGVGPEGTVYCGYHVAQSFSDSADEKFYALNTGGELLWSIDHGATSPYMPMIAADGTLYMYGTALSAVNPDGTLRWTYSEPAYQHFVNACALDGNGTVFTIGGIANWQHNTLLALSPLGELMWSYPDLGGLQYSAPVIGANGRLYLVDGFGMLLAYGLQ